MAISLPHREAYRKNLDVIMRSVTLDDLLPKLLAKECITCRQYGKVKAMLITEGPSSAAEILFLEHLSRNPDVTSFVNVIIALYDTRQDVLASLLQETYEELTGISLSREPPKKSKTSETAQISPSESNCPMETGVAPPSGVISDVKSIQQRSTNLGFQSLDVSVEPVQSHGNNSTSNTTAVELSVSPAAVIPQVKEEDLNMDLNKSLGSGHYGSVYKCEWMGTVVAVKQLPVTFKKKTKKKETSDFVREADFCARLQHPNIIQLLAYCFGRFGVHLVYEFVDGYNLDDIIFGVKETFQLKWLDKVKIGEDICKALRYLHESDPVVIHGDIRLTSILVPKLGLTGKLCDLGLRKWKTRYAPMITGGMQDRGSPMYTSPEQLIYNEPTTTKSDMYSFGVILLELFTETEIWDFEGDRGKFVTKMKEIIECSTLPPALEHLEDGVVKCVITGCLSYDVTARPSAQEIMTQLHHEEINKVN